MAYLQINNRKEFRKFRKDLRNNLTPAEARLWSLLKGKQLDGRKFRRQHGVGKYILDFYCPTERLAIELDGAQHYGAAGMKRDAVRTEYLNSYGIEVLRFPNAAVFLREEEVLREIRGRFK